MARTAIIQAVDKVRDEKVLRQIRLRWSAAVYIQANSSTQGNFATGKIAQFSCKLDVEEKMWSVETGLPFSGNDKDLSRVDFEVDEAAGILRITPDYTIRRTNRRTNMVYPFYLHEGTELVGVMG